MIYEHTCPQCTECSAVFDQKRHDPHAPPSLFTRSHSKQLPFVSPEEKHPRKKTFANVEVVKQKTAETVKGIKINKFKNSFEQWEKMSQ